MAHPIPEGHRTVAPYLAMKNGVKALEFYKKAFGASERYKLVLPDGRLGHAEITIGRFHHHAVGRVPRIRRQVARYSRRIAGEHPSLRATTWTPSSSARSTRGRTETKPVMDQFYGDRSGQLEDPFGHLWWVATHQEDVPPTEMEKRVRKLFGGGA